ncbi:MAG: chemotaxis response regulator protein-glutamate methylesterase [Nitrospirota bacterium]|nr:chemotaxis response regulator protein-glutamate methylesterase [Nitrospirota bacterium]
MISVKGESPIRVLIVDDSVIVRKAVSDALKPDPEIDVIGMAQNGKIALEKIPALKPDVIVLDIEMPICDGFDVLKGIRKLGIRVRVIMFSTLTERGASQTIKALSLGANDYVAKPSSGTKIRSYSEGVKAVALELTPKIKQFRKRPLLRGTSSQKPLASPVKRASITPIRRRPLVRSIPQIIAIGISTGGPEALAKLLPHLSGSLSVPVVIVQHMPPLFTKLLAERLNGASKLKILEAENGMKLEAGIVYIAPGDYHMEVQSGGGQMSVVLNQKPPENSCRPAADVLFRSVAALFGNRALGVIMTGMGHDGLKGLRLMHEKGAAVIAQDEASSVVWGMPSGVVQEGLADKVLPLDQLAGAIELSVSSRRPPLSAQAR